MLSSVASRRVASRRVASRHVTATVGGRGDREAERCSPPRNSAPPTTFRRAPRQSIGSLTIPPRFPRPSWCFESVNIRSTSTPWRPVPWLGDRDLHELIARGRRRDVDSTPGAPSTTATIKPSSLRSWPWRRDGHASWTSLTVVSHGVSNWDAAQAISQLDVMYGPVISHSQVNAPVRLRVAALAAISAGPGVDATNVRLEIVCVVTVPFAHRARGEDEHDGSRGRPRG